MAPTEQATYMSIRGDIKPGDSVMFVGSGGLFSWAIRTFTGRPTHVAPVAWLEDPDGRNRVVLVEAIEGKGVVWCYLSERIAAYNGSIYVAKLGSTIKRDGLGIGDFLRERIGLGYAMMDAILSAPSQWFRIPGRERLEALFCSKLDWQSKRYGGKINPAFLGNDPSPTPHQLAKLPCWSRFIQIKGEPRAL